MPDKEGTRDGSDQSQRRYLASIRQWAARTRDWEQSRARLHGPASRVTTTALGKRLNEQLVELRALLDDGVQDESLERLVGSIANIMSQIATNGGSDDKTGAVENLRAILDALREASPPGRIRRQVEALRGQLSRRAPDTLRHDVIEWLNRALCIIERAPTAPDRTTRTTRGTKALSETDAVPINISKTLTHLLDQLLLPSALVADAVALQDKLKKGLPYEELPETMERIAELILKSVWEESEDFEHFLRQLTERLSDLQSFIVESDSDAKKAHDNSAALGRQIRDHVQGLHGSLDKAIDLNQLKSNVSGQLDTIILRLDDFRHAQQQHQHLWEQQIEHLRVKLKNTEEEANRLRQTLLQQQMRAQTDPLTEIANREAYNERLAYEFARWRRYGTPLSLVIGDVDHFKLVNDRFGHGAGDKVLKGLARLLKDNLREADFIARFGGEEFVILMPETAQDNAAKAAEKLRHAVEKRSFSEGVDRLPLTISFGATDFRKHDTPESAFNRADKALYKAKEAGRNRVAAAPH